MGVPVGSAEEGDLVGLPVGFLVDALLGDLVGADVVGVEEGA